jgi:hypothetical protein
VSDQGAGRPGYRGSIPGRGERIFPLASLPRPALGPTQAPVEWAPGVLSPVVKRGRGVTLTTYPHLVPKSRMSRTYTSSPPKHLRGVYWNSFSFIHMYICYSDLRVTVRCVFILSCSVWCPLLCVPFGSLEEITSFSSRPSVGNAPLEHTLAHDDTSTEIFYVTVSILGGNLSTRRNTGQTSKSWVEERSSGTRTNLPS